MFDSRLQGQGRDKPVSRVTLDPSSWSRLSKTGVPANSEEAKLLSSAGRLWTPTTVDDATTPSAA